MLLYHQTHINTLAGRVPIREKDVQVTITMESATMIFNVGAGMWYVLFLLQAPFRSLRYAASNNTNLFLALPLTT
jgi:hypothetical protein